MPSPLKLANLWRVVREVDLQGMRLAARERFTLVVVSETGEDAARLRDLISGTTTARTAHPWIEVASTAPAVVAALPASALAALIVTRDPALSVPLASAERRLSASSTPVLTVVVGDTSPAAKVMRGVERARVAVPALDAQSIEPIASALIELVSDDQQVALAAQLPMLRPVVFARIIERTARANASFALTTGLAETIPLLTAPLNLGDMVILTKNQLMMCYRIALAAGRDDEPRKMMTEILGVLGGGVLFRQIARQLVGLIPIAGLLPKVAIAYAGTTAIGRAMAAWTTEGRQITVDTVSRYSREALDKGRLLASHMVDEAAATPGRATRRFERLRRWLPSKTRE
jgi:uncharacterized protein (DUF697 family)